MSARSEDDGVVQVPLERLAALANPLLTPPWPTVEHCFEPADLLALAEADEGLAQPYEERLALEWGPREHARRIAWFVRHGWSEPLDIDVGVPGLWVPRWCVMDGNHRLAAALVSRRSHVAAQVSGSVEYAWELLGVRP